MYEIHKTQHYARLPTNNGSKAAMTCAVRPISPAGVASPANVSDIVRPNSATPTRVSSRKSSTRNQNAIPQRTANSGDTSQRPTTQRHRKNAAPSITGTSTNVAPISPICGARNSTRIVPRTKPKANKARQYGGGGESAGHVGFLQKR